MIYFGILYKVCTYLKENYHISIVFFRKNLKLLGKLLKSERALANKIAIIVQSYIMQNYESFTQLLQRASQNILML